VALEAPELDAMRCRCCDRVQTPQEVRLYDDFCRECYEKSTRPDDEREDQKVDIVRKDNWWRDG